MSTQSSSLVLWERIRKVLPVFRLIIVALLFASIIGVAQPDDGLLTPKKTLQGLADIGVIVKVDRNLPGGDNIQSTAQTEAELELRQSGINVLNGGGKLSGTTKADLLYITIDAFPIHLDGDNGSAPLYAYTVTSNLYEGVSSLRLPSTDFMAIIWQDRYVGAVGAEKTAELANSVKITTDAFVNDWLAANPRPNPVSSSP